MSSNRNSASRPDSRVSVRLAGGRRGEKGKRKGFEEEKEREVQGGGF
ncbi:hypothetical protein PITC_092180 [Penicillium italicum]|uniref:Uncharacterized protein n=1 Tax=Penicillium italicum TaxID=40296 RepID=A0A0A2LDG5_PENIT|nr:hypothetical protein PITC_092180 [Penicillium italicum]